MTRAHAPDCGAFFGTRCDCAVGAMTTAEAEVERLRIEVRRLNSTVTKAEELAVSAGWRLDEANAERVALRAQVEHFRRRLDAEAMRANEAAERARDATNLLGKCLEELRKHEREYHHETAPDLLAQVEHYLMELHR